MASRSDAKRYLHRQTQFESNDVDEVRDALSTMGVPHSFETRGPAEGFSMRLAAVPLGRLHFMTVDFGDAEIEVKSPEDGTHGFLFCTVTGGAGLASHAGREWGINETCGSMRDFAHPLWAREHDFSCVGLPLPLSLMRDHARALIGPAADSLPLAFDPAVDFTTPKGRLLRKTLLGLLEAIDEGLMDAVNPLVAAQAGELLLTQILTHMPNPVADWTTMPTPPRPVPFYVKRARNYIHDHADRPVSVSDLAQAAGCAYRTLQAGFQDAFDMSPMDYLRAVRLTHVRTALKMAETGTTISQVAQAWGFSHMGRFARDYQRQFGEFPSDTLRSRT